MWRSAVQEHVAIFLFALTDNLVFHQGTTGTEIRPCSLGTGTAAKREDCGFLLA